MTRDRNTSRHGTPILGYVNGKAVYESNPYDEGNTDHVLRDRWLHNKHWNKPTHQDPNEPLPSRDDYEPSCVGISEGGG